MLTHFNLVKNLVDKDLVKVRRQLNFCPANLYLFLSSASLSILISDSPISEQSSSMLLIHFSRSLFDLVFLNSP